MSDRLFVTLFLLSGFCKSFVEIREYSNQDRPISIEWEGKTFKLVGVPRYDQYVWNDNLNTANLESNEGEPVYVEVAHD